MRAPTLLPLGDAAFTLTLDAQPGPETTALLVALADALADAPGVVECAPSFQTLTVHLDPLTADRAALQDRAVALATRAAAAAGPARRWALPVCLDPDLGPDQAEVAAETGLSVDAALALLLDRPLAVLAVGFLPGFAFCGMVAEPLRLKRKATPRLRVPAGSVAVANGFAGVYPWVSPGGWRLLGRCPLRLFDPLRAPPALLAPGDGVRFVAVDRAEHDRLAAVADLDAAAFREAP